jgi:hypothetical protein
MRAPAGSAQQRQQARGRVLGVLPVADVVARCGRTL